MEATSRNTGLQEVKLLGEKACLLLLLDQFREGAFKFTFVLLLTWRGHPNESTE